MDLARDEENRYRIKLRDGETRGSIGHAGPGRDTAHAELSRGPRVAVGHQCSGLFLTHEDVLDLRMAIQRVVNRHRVRAWNSKHDLDAVSRQIFNNELAASHLLV